MYSFDVYDTLITRIVEKPTDIFELIQEYLFQHNSTLKREQIEQYAEVRILSEMNARRMVTEPSEDVSLCDIYDMVKQMSCIDANDIQQLMDIEIHIEKECTLPIQHNINRIKELLSLGEHVVLISDMYLPSQVVREILTKYDLVFETIPLYVSGEVGLCKSTGSLYSLIRQIEDVQYDEWLHVGDNKVSDYEIPKLLGINAELYTMDNTMGLSEEYYYEIRNKVPNLYSSLYYGIQRANIHENSNTIMYNLGYAIAAPLLLGYVRWILEMSECHEIHTLLFIARDGYILKQIADFCICMSEYDIETKYVYGSREAWRTTDEKKQSRVRGYFEEVLKDSTNVAFVDLNGTGRSLENLQRILGNGIIAFYYTYVGTYPSNLEKLMIYGELQGSGLNELFCRANHGKTVDYSQSEAGKWSPVFEQDKLIEWNANGMDEYMSGIMEFVRRWNDCEKRLDIKLDTRTLGFAIFNYMCSFMPINTINCLGELYHSDEKIGVRKYAPILSKADVEEYIKNESTFPGMNFPMSLARSGKEISDYYNNKLQEECEKRRQLRTVNPNAKKVVLYGAGKNGKKVYLKCCQKNDFDIVLWVDGNSEHYKDTKLDIAAVDEIKNVVYDYIFITVMSNSKSIKTALVEKGYKKEKILLPNEYTQFI